MSFAQQVYQLVVLALGLKLAGLWLETLALRLSRRERESLPAVGTETNGPIGMEPASPGQLGSLESGT